jgi:beta-lactamase class C
MHQFLVILSTCLGLLVAACESRTLPEPVQTVPPVDTALLHFAQDYARYFENALYQSKGVGAALVIVKDSQIVLQQGYGWKDASSGDSVTPQTVFRIGSLSKGFTGVLTGILVHRGLLRWDDKVVQYVPAFHLRDEKQAARIEVRHLLSHTTGLPYHAYTNLIEDGFDLPAIIEHYLPKSPVCGKEGEFYAYQNAAFSISGLVMQSVTGKEYATLLQEYILDPAGMKATSCSYAAIQSTPDKAYPHVWTGAHWRAQPIDSCYYNAAEAGGINSNVEDMGRWLKVLLGQRPDIIPNSALDEVFRPMVKTGKERRIQGGWIGRDEASYAMGWRVLEHGGDTIIYHGGYVNGFRGEIAFDRRKGIGMCVLFNGPTDLSGTCVQAFFERYRQR